MDTTIEKSKQEIDELIKCVRESRKKIDENHPIIVMWHVLLGFAFTLTWVNVKWTFSEPMWIWSGLVGFGWMVTLFWLRRYFSQPSEVSAMQNKFIFMWVLEGLIFTFLGFSSTFDVRFFEFYPFIFALLMANLIIILELAFNLRRLKFIALVWFVVAVGVFFINYALKFLVVGTVCFIIIAGLYMSKSKERAAK